MSLFGQPKTVKEVMNDQKKAIKGNQRDLDKELLMLDRQEKQTALEIKKLVKQGQNTAAKQLAKEIVRIRNQRTKIYSMKGKLSGVAAHATTVQTQHTMVKSMSTATRAVAVGNHAMPVQAIQRTAMNYEKQSQMADMKSEMMDDVLDNDVDDVEADQEVDQVLDSIGLNVTEQMSRVNAGASSLPSGAKTGSTEDKELQKLLESMP